MKTNILFVVDEQKYGGVSKVLITILNSINYKDKEIDVLILHNNGDYIKRNIPDQVNIIYGTNFFNIIDIPLKKVLKQKKLVDIKNKLKLVFYMKTGLIKFALQKERKKILNKNYDIEIAFKDGFPVLFTGIGNSRRKISWLHTDYKVYDCTKNYRSLFAKTYNNIDYVVAITEDVAKDFNNIYNCQFKTTIIENLIDDNEISNLANEKNPYKENINFVCVGRLSKEKGFDRLIEALENLKKEGILRKEKFNIIGDGPEYDNLINMINSANLKDNVKLYGYKENPYPYIKYADMLLLTSLYEGLGLVLYEALFLKVPCFSTKISEINNTLNNGFYGKIVENSKSGIYLGLKEILTNLDILDKYKNNLKEYKYTKKYDILNKLENILGDVKNE